MEKLKLPKWYYDLEQTVNAKSSEVVPVFLLSHVGIMNLIKYPFI